MWIRNLCRGRVFWPSAHSSLPPARFSTRSLVRPTTVARPPRKESRLLAQAFVLFALGVTLVLFVWGRWRYDLVALACLMTLTVVGIVPAREAFLGCGHPAVVTVAAVLVIGRALTTAGFVSVVTRWLTRLSGPRPSLQIPALTGLVAVLSSFMNNVGALALLLPVAIRMAHESERPASAYLMPLAFGSLFGGLVTLIGTPPNIIIASFRAEQLEEPFRMFDFAPVGAERGSRSPA